MAKRAAASASKRQSKPDTTSSKAPFKVGDQVWTDFAKQLSWKALTVVAVTKVPKTESQSGYLVGVDTDFTCPTCGDRYTHWTDSVLYLDSGWFFKKEE
jgi:hypothetical protein